MTYIQGRVPVIWNMQEVAGLDYFAAPFNDPAVVAEWTRLYGRDFSIGAQADYRRPQPGCQTQILRCLRSQGLCLDRVAFSWYRMNPGDIIPEHSDSYASYCRYHQVDSSCVVRILVLLEHWQPGYLLEVSGEAITAYPAGTWVMWSAHTPHMAGNLGRTPRYTLQITATVNE